jgi:hypothetical protein
VLIDVEAGEVAVVEAIVIGKAVLMYVMVVDLVLL